MQTATLLGPQCSSAIGTTLTAIGGYTPASSSLYAVVTELTVANRTTSNITIAMSLFNGSTDYYFFYNAPLNGNDTIFVPGKFTLTNGWYVRANCTVASGIDVTMCVTQYS